MDNLQMTQQEIAKAGVTEAEIISNEAQRWNYTPIEYRHLKKVLAALRLLEPVAAGTHVIIARTDIPYSPYVDGKFVP